MEYLNDKNDLQKTNPNFNLYLATCTTDLIGISLGCSIAWSSPTLPKLEEPNDQIVITKDQSAWLGSLLCLGGCLGPFINITIVDRIGRKRALIIYTFFMTVSWVMFVLFNQIEMMYVARFLNGLVIGPVSILIPMYIAEISSIETRGTTGSFFGIFIYFGCCIPYFIGPFTSYMTLNLISASLAFIGFIFSLKIPESPHYFLIKGLKSKAYGTIQWLRGFPEKKIIQQEIDDIQKNIDSTLKQNSNVSCTQCLKNWTNIKCFYYVSMLLFFQQFSGYNAVVYYSESVFRLTGSSFSSVISTMICGGIMLISASVVPYMTKILRIKTILLLSAVGCCSFMGLLTIYFFLRNCGFWIDAFNLLPIVSIVGFIISFNIGIGPYAGVIMIEVLPMGVKVIGSAILSSLCWFCGFLFTKFFVFSIDLLGTTSVFGIFTIISVCAVFFVTFQLPDTQGLSFHEIQVLIAGNRKQSITTDKEKEKLCAGPDV